MFKRMVRSVLGVFGLTIAKTSDGLLLAPQRKPAKATVKCLFPSKFSAVQIEHALLQIGSRWETRTIVILTDQRIDLPGKVHASLRCGSDPVARIGEFDPSSTVFLYACDSDDVGLPYLRDIVARGGLFYPVQVFTPSAYSHIDSLAKKVAQTEFEMQSREGFDKFDFGLGDALNLMQAISVTGHLRGDYVEIGCFRGSSACIALSYMRESGLQRNCYFLDVFEGFTYQAAIESADAMWKNTHQTEGLEAIAQRISTRSNSKAGLNAIVIKSNIIEDALPEAIESVALANIDVDMYEAVLEGLYKVAPKMISGGIVVVEDPGHTPALIGARLALHEFLASPAARGFAPVYLESGQTFLIKTGP